MIDPEKLDYTVSEEEKYFFDLRGYLIISGVLSPYEIDACDTAIDHLAIRSAP